MKYFNSLEPEKKQNNAIIYVYIGVVFFLLLICAVGVGRMLVKKDDTAEITYLKIKINPEFIFGIDENENVVVFSAINEDAKNIYKEEMFQGKKYDRALDYAIEYAQKSDILDPDMEYKIEITVISGSEKDKQRYEEKIVQAIQDNDEYKDNFIPEVVEPSKEEVEQYKESNSEDFTSIYDETVKQDDNKVNSDKTNNDKVNNNKPSDNKNTECSYTKLATADLSGTDRYATAINVSKKLYPDGSKAVVLVNATSLIDGYLSQNLAYLSNSPILLTASDSIKNTTLNEIKRLKPSKIYVLGGTAAISEDVINTITKNYKTTIQRISGKDRYVTSVNLAKEAANIKSFNSVLIVPANSNSNVDAAMVGAISARYNMPVLYSKTDDISDDDTVLQYVKSNSNIEKVYFISDLFTNGVMNKYRGIGKEVEMLFGDTRVDTNISLIKKFNTSYSSIVYVSSLVDVIPASLFAAKKNAILLLVEKSMNDTQINSVIKDKKIKNIYYFGGSSIDKYTVRNMEHKIKVNNVTVAGCDVNRELLFSTKAAVFYVPHQDDESSFYGQVITAAIDELGAENVHLVLLTDGAASSVLNNKLKGMTPSEFTAARDREFLASIKQQGVKKYTLINNRFPDQGLVNNYDKLKDIMKEYDKMYNYDVTHFGYSYIDVHTDHKTIGNALNDLYFDSNLKVTEFKNVYLIAKFTYPELYKNNKDTLYNLTFVDNSNYDKIRNSFEMYKENKEENRLGIGFMSAKSVFDQFYELMDNNKLETLMHVPGKK